MAIKLIKVHPTGNQVALHILSFGVLLALTQSQRFLQCTACVGRQVEGKERATAIGDDRSRREVHEVVGIIQKANTVRKLSQRRSCAILYSCFNAIRPSQVCLLCRCLFLSMMTRFSAEGKQSISNHKHIIGVHEDEALPLSKTPSSASSLRVKDESPADSNHKTVYEEGSLELRMIKNLRTLSWTRIDVSYMYKCRMA